MKYMEDIIVQELIRKALIRKALVDYAENLKKWRAEDDDDLI